jgi:hypothetical protein
LKVERESELEMALRHVAQGERHVEAQRRILAHLRELGGATDVAEQLLAEFEDLLAVHKSHLRRIEAGEAQ